MLKTVKSYWLQLLLAALLVFMIVCPLVMIFAEAAITDGRLDFSAAFRTITTPGNLLTIYNSLLLGFAVVAVSTLIAAPLAYILSRTQLARYKFLDIIFMIPFMTPPYIASMGWILFMQKRGLLEQLWPQSQSFSPAFFSFGGLVLVMSLHIFPFMMSILKNAMLNIPESLLESGAVFGAGFTERLRKIFLPLLTGNYVIGALLVFVKTISEYGTPATLGHRIGFYVFTTDIHRYATTAPIDFGQAASLSSVLIAICLIFWYCQNYITARKSYNLISGKGSRVQPPKLALPALTCCILYLAAIIIMAIGIPYFSVISTSLIKLRGFGLAEGNFTYMHYIDLFLENPKGQQALTNSFLLAVSSATIAAALGTLTVLAVRSLPKKCAKALEAISLLPEMLPGIATVIGLMLFWNHIYKLLPLYNTPGILVLTYVVLFLPFSVQYVTSSFTQISANLLGAGRIFGGTPKYVFRRITLPLLSKGILTGWMMTFIIAFRELVAPSLIAPPNMLVVSTFIIREFEQGSVSIGMAMAVICVLFTTISLIALNKFINRQKG